MQLVRSASFLCRSKVIEVEEPFVFVWNARM